MEVDSSWISSEVAGCIKVYDMRKQQFNWLPLYSKSTLITFILTWQREGCWPGLEKLQTFTDSQCKTKEILGYGFMERTCTASVCECVCVMWWWQELASAWHSANSASCPARPSSSPCWLDILPGSAQPARTRAPVIYPPLKADRPFVILLRVGAFKIDVRVQW